MKRKEGGLWGQIDLRFLFSVIDELYNERIIKNPSIRSIHGKQTTCTRSKEEIQEFYNEVLLTILKNEKVFRRRKPSTILSSAVYVTGRKLGIKITYRSLYKKIGATEYAVSRTVKQLQT